MTTANYYSPDATSIIRTSTHATLALALAACRRASKRGQIAAIAGGRVVSDQPTCHH